MTDTIEIKATWTGTIDALIVLIRDGNKESQQFAREELHKLAETADEYIASR